MKKYLLFGIAIVFSFGVNAQWKGTTTNDDQRTMMVQRHMDLYPKNDQSQLKNIFNKAWDGLHLLYHDLASSVSCPYKETWFIS